MLRQLALLAPLLMAACATGTTYLGRSVTETPFKVDGGQTVMLPMTNAGALPAETEQFKIEMAGVHAALTAGQPEQSKLTWVFSTLVKKREPIEFVTVERVTEEGELIPLVDDRTVALKNSSWVGRSKSQDMSSTSSPWLYQQGDSKFLFKFTLRVAGKAPVVMYQPSLIGRQAKAIYLDVIRKK